MSAISCYETMTEVFRGCLSMFPGPSYRLRLLSRLASWTGCACFRLFCWSLYFMYPGDSFPLSCFFSRPVLPCWAGLLPSTITCYYIVFIYIYYIRARVPSFPHLCTCRGWAGVAGARAVPLFMYAGGFSRAWERWAVSGLFWRPGPGPGLSELRRLSPSLLGLLRLFGLVVCWASPSGPDAGGAGPG